MLSRQQAFSLALCRGGPGGSVCGLATSWGAAATTYLPLVPAGASQLAALEAAVAAPLAVRASQQVAGLGGRPLPPRAAPVLHAALRLVAAFVGLGRGDCAAAAAAVAAAASTPPGRAPNAMPGVCRAWRRAYLDAVLAERGARVQALRARVTNRDAVVVMYDAAATLAGLATLGGGGGVAGDTLADDVVCELADPLTAAWMLDPGQPPPPGYRLTDMRAHVATPGAVARTRDEVIALRRAMPPGAATQPYLALHPGSGAEVVGSAGSGGVSGGGVGEAARAAVDAWVVMAVLGAALRRAELDVPFRLVEMPSARLFAAAERAGIGVDVALLWRQTGVVSDRLALVEAQGRALLDGVPGWRAGARCDFASVGDVARAIAALRSESPPATAAACGAAATSDALRAIIAATAADTVPPPAAAFCATVLEYRVLAPLLSQLHALARATRPVPAAGGPTASRAYYTVDCRKATGRVAVVAPPLQCLAGPTVVQPAARASVQEELLRSDTGAAHAAAASGASVREYLLAVPPALVVLPAAGGAAAGWALHRCTLTAIATGATVASPPLMRSSTGAGGASLAAAWRSSGAQYDTPAAAGVRQVVVRLGDGVAGGPEVAAPADAVFRTAAPLVPAGASLTTGTLPPAARACLPWSAAATCTPRAAIVPPVGCTLLSADYAQIEVRMLAHLSGDARLCAALAAGSDVFRDIAGEVRPAATRKRVCFFALCMNAHTPSTHLRSGMACRRRQSVTTCGRVPSSWCTESCTAWAPCRWPRH